MAELGAAVTAHAKLPFPAQVAIGRALVLWLIGEAILVLISWISVNRLPRSARTHALFALSGAVAAATPLFANAAQWVAQPFLAIFFSALCGALAQAGLWAIVYLLTGVALDWLAGRPPRFEVVWEHWRTGFIKGAVYGALFMGLILIAALILRVPGAPAFFDRGALIIGPLFGALLFPLGQTIVGSADGTPPVLRAAESGLSRSARTRARARRRARPRTRLSRRSRRLRWRHALSRDGRDRRSLLRRRRPCLRRGKRDPRRTDESCKVGGSIRLAFCSAA